VKTGEGIIVEPIGWKNGHFTLGVKIYYSYPKNGEEKRRAGYWWIF
jgi:hypothetical protein